MLITFLVALSTSNIYGIFLLWILCGEVYEEFSYELMASNAGKIDSLTCDLPSFTVVIVGFIF